MLLRRSEVAEKLVVSIINVSEALLSVLQIYFIFSYLADILLEESEELSF